MHDSVIWLQVERFLQFVLFSCKIGPLLFRPHWDYEIGLIFSTDIWFIIFVSATERKRKDFQMLVFSSPECIAWLAVFMTESVAIVTLNVITAIVFIKNPSLCKGSLYLVINLAVADMFVGGFSNSVNFVITGAHCNFWKYSVPTFGIWDNIIYSIEQMFPITSLTNIAAISLQRLHAIFFPFRHRVIKKWIFVAIMAVIWVLAALFSTALVVLSNLEGQGRSYFYLWLRTEW